MTRSTLRLQATPDLPHHSSKEERGSASVGTGRHWIQTEQGFKIHTRVVLSRILSISESLFPSMKESVSLAGML